MCTDAACRYSNLPEVSALKTFRTDAAFCADLPHRRGLPYLKSRGIYSILDTVTFCERAAVGPGEILIVLLWITHLITIFYEWRNRSLSVLLWGVLFVVFTVPHTLHIYAGDYPEEVLGTASAFALVFTVVYLCIRFIYFRRKKLRVSIEDRSAFRDIPKREADIFFAVYVLSFLVVLAGFYARGYSLSGSTWTDTLYREMSIPEQIAKMIVISLSGTAFVCFMRKERLRFLVATLIFGIILIMTKSRYNMLGYATPFILYMLFSRQKRKRYGGVLLGVLFVILVFFVQQMRWAGSFQNALSLGFAEVMRRSLNYMLTGQGEMGLLKAFYYFIGQNNDFPDFGEGNGYIRLFLFAIPSSLLPIKPRDFAIDMYREWFHVDNPAGTMHPTLFGDVYANFGFGGCLMGAFYAVFAIFVDENMDRTSDTLVQALKMSAAATMMAMLARGAVYNAIFNYICAWIIIELIHVLSRWRSKNAGFVYKRL